MGFHRWREVAPPHLQRIKALFATGMGYRLARGTAAEVKQRYPRWCPFAWQVAPSARLVLPTWRDFPEALPLSGRLCCVMYFDLQGKLGDSAGFGRYRGGWPLGGFEERSAYPGEPNPIDPTRWAPYAWRDARAEEVLHAALTAALQRDAPDTEYAPQPHE